MSRMILFRLLSNVRAVAVVAFMVAMPVDAMAELVADFYAGKTITIYVGFTAGGGYDLYARQLAPFLTKHIPGRPAVIVKNMPGAGSLKLAVYMQNVAPRDGTELATVSRGAPAEALLAGNRIKFDPVIFNWIGSMNNEVSICALMAQSGAATLEDLKKREFLLGTHGIGSDSALFAVFIKNLFGVKLKILTGYSGTNESILAMERGEVDGNCGWSWSTAKQTHPHWFRDKTVNIIMQMALSKHPDLPDVPAVTEFARNHDEKSQIDLVLSRQLMGRPFFAPPAVPPERIAALRKAFMDAMKDFEFADAAEKANLEINPVPGEEVQALVERLFKAPAHVVAATRKNTEF